MLERMEPFTYLAARCYIPTFERDLRFASLAIRSLRFFHQLNDLCASEQHAHIPEDDCHIWVSAIYKVPAQEIAAMLYALRALPYCYGLWLPHELVATSMSLASNRLDEALAQAINEASGSGEDQIGLVARTEQMTVACQEDK